jgi:hypothetical protein
MEIRTPSFPKVPKFKTNLEALAGLDLYIDSLDAYFKGLDREFSKVNFDLSGMADMLRMGSNASRRRTRDMFFI